ncbi:TIGR02679 domain-containing protein [Streptosporangium sp. NPDC000095]|uniref:TIGR02679 domain-containing protein n=1 Tax=Streptosporangium sp. NPDC000095 TaxID=3366184 RepID=UPI0036980681
MTHDRQVSCAPSGQITRSRRRLEQGKPLTGTVTLGRASPEQRRAVELLLGRSAGTGASLSVSLEEVDRVLRSSDDPSSADK